jgi:hypothetical protein
VIELLLSSDRVFNALHNISFLIDPQAWSGELYFPQPLSLSLSLSVSLCLSALLCSSLLLPAPLSVADLASALHPTLVLLSQLCDIFASITLSKTLEDSSDNDLHSSDGLDPLSHAPHC